MELAPRTGLSARRLGALLVMALLCLGGAGACGSAGAGSSASTPMTRSVSAASTPMSRSERPPVRQRPGDYDEDDYGAGHDADDDDTPAPNDNDGDSDNPNGAFYDSDDTDVLAFGRPATAIDTRGVEATVKRYFAVAASEDGSSGCRFVASRLSRNLAQSQGGGGGPPYTRGDRTCAEVVTKIFRFYHRQLATEARAVEVASVRVKGVSALAVLTFKSLPGFPARLISLEREGGTWKIEGVLDNELP